MKKLALILVLILAVGLFALPAGAAWPDGESLGTKLNAAMIAYASYWNQGSPAPSADQQWLAKQFSVGAGTSDMNRYITVLAQLQGYNDATTYATINAWLTAREGELVRLFKP